MAKFFRTDKCIGYLTIGFMELIKYSHNGFPVCDCCLKDLIGYNDIILIPYENQAYCKACGTRRLKEIIPYEEDNAIREKRERFWLDYFKLEEEIENERITDNCKSATGKDNN